MAQPLVIVDYYADWCAPCKMMGPVLDRLQADHPDIILEKVDIDVQDVTKAGINSVPTFVFMRDGVELARQVGAIPYAKFDQMVKQFKEEV